MTKKLSVHTVVATTNSLTCLNQDGGAGFPCNEITGSHFDRFGDDGV